MSRKVVFKFTNAAWPDVFNWLKKESNLAFAAPVKPPSGTFSFSPPKNPDGGQQLYTIAEAVDILNDSLIAKGSIVTVDEGRLGFVEVDQVFDPTIMTVSSVKDLEKHGPNEMVRMFLRPKTLSARDLVKKLEPVKGKLAIVSTLDRVNGVVLSDQVSNLREAVKIFDELEETRSRKMKELLAKYERVATIQAAIDYLSAVDSSEHADRLMSELLAMPGLRREPTIWRQASNIAAKRGHTLRQFEYLEKALDLEFAHMPEVFSLEPIRRDYGALLDHYQWLADASKSLKTPPPADLIARTMKAADRWRSLDPEVTRDCDLTAKILRTIGGPEAESLAWDYLTTPLALKPNESEPWLGLAQSATTEGDLKLADKCFEAAFAAEPTNAQILWDRAQLLERRGEISKSQELMRQLVAGEWQPRFESLRMQARQVVEGK